MKIKRIIVKNFRLLKDFSIDLEDELSLIVGKNNVGKTSLLLVLDKFLNKSTDDSNKIKYNDFNLDLQNEIEQILDENQKDPADYSPKSVSLRIIAEYQNDDSLDNINKTLTNLTVDNNFFALGFDYLLDYDGYVKMYTEYQEAKTKYDNAHQVQEGEVYVFDKSDFLRTNIQKYFKTIKKSIEVKAESMELDEDNYVDLSTVLGFHLDDVINFQYISARRSVDNKDRDKSLSEKTSDLYKAQEDSDENMEARNDFIDKLKDTDSQLTAIYDKVFQSIINDVEQLGGMRRKDTVIKVISSLQHKELLKGNTTVVYEHDARALPENYNGLGYMNLISIIFDIKLCIENMKRAKKRRPSDINLLFIEEPEAHTHPQMQYVFIKNIKKLLGNGIQREDGINEKLQYIVSTHSSHIVADSDFDDIKYLRRKEGENSVESKNLKDLKKMYNVENGAYKFLRQYLTLINSELFFADKAIFVEGDTERILLPVMMQKIDETTPPDVEHGEIGLLSQNISLIPIGGAYSHIFDKFFHFIGLSKMLIITDLDIGKKEGRHEKCQYDDTVEQVTTNAALKYYFGNDKDIAYYVALTAEQKLFKWDDRSGKMVQTEDGNMRIAFETKENNYQARSFEDSFFEKNKDFIKSATFDESALQISKFVKFKRDGNSYALADDGVNSKSALAVGILLAETDENKWEVPDYIKEGLLWIRK